jgi:hypothetical protein
MKIGVSEGDLSRILKHHETYGVIYEQIRILNCKNKKLAFKVEKYLLDNLPKPPNKLIKNDGYSEIREIKYLNKCKELLIRIKKDPLFSYKESKYIEYKYYSINQLKNIYKELHDIDLSFQIEKLTNLDYKKYSSIYEPTKNYCFIRKRII